MASTTHYTFEGVKPIEKEAKRLFGELQPEKLPKLIVCADCGERQPDIGRKHCFWCMAEFQPGMLEEAYIRLEDSLGIASASTQKPTIVCLCGSTRFGEAFRNANLNETLAGKIVLSIGCTMKSDAEIFGYMTDEERQEITKKLEHLHFRKIELADEVLILNVGGYIGESTGRELEYARKLGKVIRFLEARKEKCG